MKKHANQADTCYPLPISGTSHRVRSPRGGIVSLVYFDGDPCRELDGASSDGCFRRRELRFARLLAIS